MLRKEAIIALIAIAPRLGGYGPTKGDDERQGNAQHGPASMVVKALV